MTDAVQTAVIVSIAPTIVALWNIKKSNQIHVLVNSQLTSVKADLVLALDRVGKLKRLLVEKEK